MAKLAEATAKLAEGLTKFGKDVSGPRAVFEKPFTLFASPGVDFAMAAGVVERSKTKAWFRQWAGLEEAEPIWIGNQSDVSDVEEVLRTRGSGVFRHGYRHGNQ